MKKTLSLHIIIFLLALITSSCNTQRKEVVVYASVDRMFSEPILEKFEKETGIKVLAVYDVEAAKTTGLVNRLIAERRNPRADVFWNGEFAQTIRLKEEDVLSPYVSENAMDIPEKYKDPDERWTGFCGRARILLVNTELMDSPDYPESIFDMINIDQNLDEVAIAYPLFGTTFTHAAAIYAFLGEADGRKYFEVLRDKGIHVAPGNSTVRDMVAKGQMKMGFTDTDDACGAIKRGAPVKVIFPDQNTIGTLIVPNTVAMIDGGPNPQEAKILIDYLLRKETEQLLSEMGWSQVSLRKGNNEKSCLGNVDIKGMDIPLEEIYFQMQKVKEDMSEIFIK